MDAYADVQEKVGNIDLPQVIDFEPDGFHRNISEKVRYDRLVDMYCMMAHENPEPVIIYCTFQHYFILKRLIPDAKFWVAYYPFADIVQYKKKFRGKELDFNYGSLK